MLCLKSLFISLLVIQTLVESKWVSPDNSTDGLLNSPYPNDEAYTFVLLGITGDLSQKKLMPTLFTLYKEGLLPKNFQIAGFAHSKSSVEAIKKLVDPYVVNTLKNEHERQLYEQFWKIVTYNSGDSQSDKDLAPVTDIVNKFETGKKKGHRLVYFALPAYLFAKTAAAVKTTLYSKTGWTRLVIEKPFGKDSESSKELSDALSLIWTEKEIYRIDH
ncbi:unnamed protein product, partial [Medioppia subpectinata]